MAHQHGYPDNGAEHLDSILGKGKGDPDAHGYPGEKPDDVPYVGEQTAKVEHCHADSELLDLGEIPF